MTSETRSKFSPAYNLKLITEQFGLLPRVTLIIILIYSGYTLYQGFSSDLGIMRVAVDLVLGFFWVLFWKSLIHSGRYRALYGMKYPGSILVLSAIFSSILVLLYLAEQTWSPNPFTEDFPFQDLEVVFMIWSFWFVTYAVEMRLENWLHRHEPGVAYYRRHIGLED